MKGEIIGLLQILNKLDGEDFNEEYEKLLLRLASQAAIAIENARL
jgi:GAF domain-containing protein